MSPSLDRHPRVSALLDGPLGWHTLQHHPAVTSTSDIALELAQQGTPPGVVVVADHQTAGRGRRGRPWLDRSGDGAQRSLLVSMVVPVPEREITLTPLAVGLAVGDALRRTGATPTLKWPNDVLLVEVPPGSAPGGVTGAAPDAAPEGVGTSQTLRTAKCAGILVDRHAIGDGEVLVIGIGVDLDWRGVDRGGEEAAWMSVAEATGRDVDRGDVLADLLRGLSVWLRSATTDPTRMLLAYRDNCATIGRDVAVTFPDGEQLTGRASDLDREGRLIVDSPTVGKVAITAGDVEHVRPS